MFDIILAEQVYNEGNFALTLNNDRCHLISASKDLNNKIKETAQANNINLYVGDTVCTEVFDLYMTDIEEFLKRIPSGLNIVAAEMEAFALFYIAKMFNKEAACLMTVVDSKYIKQVVTPEERETHLKTMIELSLKSIEEGE